MATVDTKPEARLQPHDEAIFVAGDARRARRLGRAAIVATLLAALWIIGLGVGMLGFGSLPGVSLVNRSHNDSPADPSRVPVGNEDVVRGLSSAKNGSSAADPSSKAAARVAPASVAKRSSGSARARARAVAKPPAATPVSPVNAAQRTRGWARKGSAAPPGQVRKAAPPPPPATSKGLHRGQAVTPPASTAPPGQAKKPVEPLPPPPPPKKG